MAGHSNFVSRVRRGVGRRLRRVGEILAPPSGDAGQRYEYQLHVNQRDRLEGKVAIVTGGGGSIGAAVCYRLAIEGATVAVAGRTLDTLEATVAQVVQAGVDPVRVFPLVLDVTDEASVRSGIETIAQAHGRIDILVNNAGASARDRVALLENQSMSVVQEIIDLNLLGAIRCARYVAIHLRQTSGRIVNFGSVVGLAGQERFADYAAAKGGISALTKSLALELASDGVTVNAVTPGMVWRNPFDGAQPRSTARTPLGRHGTSEEVAGLVAYLCSDEAAYITGVEIPIDGGRTLGLRNP